MKAWLLNLKVKQKLLLSFGLLVIFLIAVSGVGLIIMSDINKNVKSLSEVDVPTIDLMLQVDRDLQQALVAQRTFLFTEVGSEKAKELKEEFNENIGQAKERWNKLKATGHTSLTEELISIHEKEIVNWANISEKIFSLREADTTGQSTEAINLSMGEGSTTFEAAREVINKLTELVEEASAKSAHDSNESYISARNTMLTGTILILILSVFAGLGISKIIGEPLLKASNMMSELQKGHLKIRLGIKSKDEIGVLSGAMDNFANTLQELTQTMYALADGNLSVEVPLLDKDDEITPALNKIILIIKELKEETSHLTNSALEGKLSTRGDISKFSGGYKEIVKGFNDTLDAVILPVKEGSDVLAVMAQGNLNIKMKGNYKGDHQLLKNSINQLSTSLSSLIGKVTEAVHATASAGNQISSSSEELAAGAQEQSSQAGDVAAAVEEMTMTILETSKNAENAAAAAKKAGEIAKTGGQVVKETIEGMKRIADGSKSSSDMVTKLGKSSEEIGEIIQVIDDIADQTNLLALNAAIEAARAGEQGRGFAVVADEVRKLAERTTKATKEIAAMIKQIQKDTGSAVESMTTGNLEVEKGRQLADKAGESLSEIIKSAEQVGDIVTQVAAASQQQSAAAEQISKNVEAISNVSHQSAIGIQQIAKASEDLSMLTTNLQNMIQEFEIEDNLVNSANTRTKFIGNPGTKKLSGK